MATRLDDLIAELRPRTENEQNTAASQTDPGIQDRYRMIAQGCDAPADLIDGAQKLKLAAAPVIGEAQELISSSNQPRFGRLKLCGAVQTSLGLFEKVEWRVLRGAANPARAWLLVNVVRCPKVPLKFRSKSMRKSSLLTAAALVVSLAACTSAAGYNFSGIPPVNATDPATQKLAQFPANPPVQMHLNQTQAGQTGPYDSPNFVVPPYEVEP